MNRSTYYFREGLISITAIIGIGLATLPTQALANRCMMMKPFGHMGPMRSYGPQYYYPPMQRPGYNPHSHAGYTNGDRQQEKPQAQSPAPAAGISATTTTGSGPDIIEIAAAAQSFQTLIRAAEAAGLYDTLRGKGPLTLFAPTDEAFANLPEGTLEALLADHDRLVAVVSFHMVPGRLTAADLLQRREFKTVQGQTLSIDQIEVALANIDASNGIIHAIDNVLVPSPSN